MHIPAEIKADLYRNFSTTILLNQYILLKPNLDTIILQ
jgi:hypothetical protein